MSESDALKMRDSRPANPLEDADYVAMAEEREREYRITTLLDRELGLEPEPEIGRGVYVAACADLRSRGIHPDNASQQELLAALRRVSP
jgi:hypothetical protein